MYVLRVGYVQIVESVVMDEVGAVGGNRHVMDCCRQNRSVQSL